MENLRHYTRTVYTIPTSVLKGLYHLLVSLETKDSETHLPQTPSTTRETFLVEMPATYISNMPAKESHVVEEVDVLWQLKEFSNRKPYGVIVSDLTYVRVKDRWGYVCVILDVHSQKIIDLAYGPKQSADLVPDAFARVGTPLHARIYFHTDRGRKFVNRFLEKLLESFGLTRSLSRKGNPYDNAVVEATYKFFKTEFVNGESLRF